MSGAMLARLDQWVCKVKLAIRVLPVQSAPKARKVIKAIRGQPDRSPAFPSIWYRATETASALGFWPVSAPPARMEATSLALTTRPGAQSWPEVKWCQ